MIAKGQSFGIKKKILKNGLTVLFKRTTAITDISVEMWYNVGSKDEQSHERGVAHLLEHMVFKGTKKFLSESDITAITHKLGGFCNAATTYDYTRYIFELPIRHWDQALPILADCMSEAVFKKDCLNSEFKAVIQEIKEEADNYSSLLSNQMSSLIFRDHPYHFPILGFKHILWNISPETLYDFYYRYYVPNNAALIIVGNLQYEEVIEKAEKFFSAKKPNKKLSKQINYFETDICAKSLILYRDTQQSEVQLVFLVPGYSQQPVPILNLISLLLCNQKESRLYKKLVLQKELITEINSFCYELFEKDLFFINFKPKDPTTITLIIELIVKEIQTISKSGISKIELQQITDAAIIDHYEISTSNADLATLIGKKFFATGSINNDLSFLQKPLVIEKEIRNLLRDYFKPILMNIGYLHTIPAAENKSLIVLQKQADAFDMKELNKRVRKTKVASCRYAKQVPFIPITHYDFPVPRYFELSNGMKVFYYDNTLAPFVSLKLVLKANSDYDPIDAPGIFNFLMQTMSLQLQHSYFSIEDNAIYSTFLKHQFPERLDQLCALLRQPTFEQKHIDNARALILADIASIADDAQKISYDLIKKNIYKHNVKSKNKLGSKKSITAITKKDLETFFKSFISPYGVKLAVVGDIPKTKIPSLVTDVFASWKGRKLEDVSYATLKPVKKMDINYPLERDQVVLSYAGLSVKRDDPAYEMLELFNQLFGGDMHSKLFKIREETGLFYSIDATLTKEAGSQPGMVYISTTVYKDNLKKIEAILEKKLETIMESITNQELLEAKNSLISSFTKSYQSNEAMADTFIFLDTYNFSADYFNQRIKNIEGISLAQMKETVKKVLDVKHLIKVRVGALD